MTHINQRRDLSTQWTATNPVLQLGEVGWETDTRRCKLGDGVTTWTGLAYANVGAVTSVNGQTGTVVLDKDDIGLTQVNNTADMNKPVSTAVQAAIDAAVATAVAAGALASYPIGSIYISVNATDPGTIFGGVWSSWGVGRTIVGVDTTDTSFDSPEETGGSKTKTLTAANLPPHVHTVDGNWPIGLSATTTTGGTANRYTNVTETGKNTGSGPGTSTPVNIMPPYITTYMFKRVV